MTLEELEEEVHTPPKVCEPCQPHVIMSEEGFLEYMYFGPGGQLIRAEDY